MTSAQLEDDLKTSLSPDKGKSDARIEASPNSSTHEIVLESTRGRATPTTGSLI